MHVSPHKKRRTNIATSTEQVASFGGRKTYTACWPFKFGKARRASDDGNKGDRGKHKVAIQPPGYPSGKCLGANDRRGVCRCGKHNRRVG